MGCTQQKKIIYNKYENISDNMDNNPSFLSGPFVSSNKKDFEDTEQYYQHKTLIEQLMLTLEQSKDNEGLGWRQQTEEGYEKKFSFITYGEVKKLSETLARNLVCLKLSFKDKLTGQEFLGVFAKNTPEWTITDIACQLMSITSVTFYSTLGELAFEHICNQTLISTICVSPESIATLITYKNKFGLDSVSNVLVFDLCQSVKESQIEVGDHFSMESQ